MRILLSKFGKNRMKIEYFLKNTPPLGSAPGARSKNFTKMSFHLSREYFFPNLVNLEKKWRFYEKRLNLAPGGAGQKFYQTFISYTKRVLLSKFAENRMKKKDFLKKAQNRPPGDTPEEGGKFFLNIFL